MNHRKRRPRTPEQVEQAKSVGKLWREFARRCGESAKTYRLIADRLAKQGHPFEYANTAAIHAECVRDQLLRIAGDLDGQAVETD